MAGDSIEEQIQDIDQKVSTLALETRAGFAEARAAQAGARLRETEFRIDVLARLDTGALADLRAEHQGHTHP